MLLFFYKLLDHNKIYKNCWWLKNISNYCNKFFSSHSLDKMYCFLIYINLFIGFIKQFILGGKKDEEPSQGMLYKLFEHLYAPFLMKKWVRAAVMIIFFGMACHSIAVVPKIEIGRTLIILKTSLGDLVDLRIIFQPYILLWKSDLQLPFR